LNSLRIVACLSPLEAVIEYTDHLGTPARLVASPHYEELGWKAWKIESA
jgi:hypothetical protein